MGSIGGPELLVLAAVVVAAIPTLWALIDILRKPDDAWQRTGQQQIVWLVVVLFGGLFGAIAYFAIIRRKLNAASS